MTSASGTARLVREEELSPELLEWVTEFVANPLATPELDGALCPALPSALSRHAVRFGLIECHYAPQSVMGMALQMGLAEALALSKAVIQGETDPLACVFWEVRGIPAWSYRGVFEREYTTLRTAALATGLMAGCFHPERRRSGRRAVVEPSLSLRSPLPAIAIRHIIPSDSLSLQGEPANYSLFLDASR